MNITSKPKLDTNMNIKTTKGVKEQIERIAKDHDTSMNNLLNQIIKDFLLRNT